MRLLALLALAAAAAAGDAKEEAWFAFRAGAQGDKTAVPRLVEALGKEPAAHRWILDALIRLEAEVPAEGVAPLFEQFPEETLILLARDPKGNEEHLAAVAEASLGDGRYVHWIAACNLLAAQKSKRLAGPLLRDLQLWLEIRVTDPGWGGGGGLGRWGGGGKVSSRIGGDRDPQWPPVPAYALLQEQKDGAVPLAPGRRTVFFARHEIQRGERDPGWSRPAVPSSRRQEQRVDYLADLLGVEPKELGFRARDARTVVWRGAEGYPADVAAVRESVEGAFSDAVRKLVERKLLDPQEAPKAPRLKVGVRDSRTDKSVPLPPLEGVVAIPE